MHVPRAWAKATGDAKAADGRTLRVQVWGWGDDEMAARSGAAERLRRVLERLRRGEPLPGADYSYGRSPLREEILRTLDENAVVTRNAYGAQVLNAARLLFLDVDVRPPGVIARLFRALRPAEAPALTRLRTALQHYGKASFRIYATASGLRAIAVDRDFDPAGREAQELMQATATDPYFARLCVAQRSFRARLTPKPWRVSLPVPPGRHPREADARRRFSEWLAKYEQVSHGYATCRYLETVGNAAAKGAAARLIDLHDRAVRCNEALPLA